MGTVMMRYRASAILLVFTCLGATTAWAAAAGRVEIVVVSEERAPITAFQDWARALNRAGIRNTKFRSARPSDQPGIEVRGTEDRPIYAVTATINSRNELTIAGKRFRRRLFQACRVDQAETEGAILGERLAAVARDPGLVVDERQPPPHQPVEERGLADIRPSGNGDGESQGETIR